jgi:hypothetical protein
LKEHEIRVKSHLEDGADSPYSQGMTPSLEAAVATVTAELDAIDDPTERYQAMKQTESALDASFKKVRQRIALELKQTRTWRQVGEIMGGVTPQRAEQISRGQ